MGFGHNDSPINRTCPNDTLPNPAQIPYSNGHTFHQLATMIAGAFTIFACLISLFLIFQHATHFSVPKEQKQVIRVIFTIPVMAVIAFLGVAFESTSIYLTPLASVYEAFAFVAFFLLLSEYLNPDEFERDAFFIQKGLSRFYYTGVRLAVFQFPLGMFLNFAVTDITEAANVFCQVSLKPQFGHFWTVVINTASTTTIAMAIISFYKATKLVIAPRKPVLKLLSFKLIVFFTFAQNTIFGILISKKALKPTSHMTYNDLTRAIPGVITCLEMAIFSLVFLYVHRVGEYRYTPGDSGNKISGLGSGGYQGGVMGLGALVQAMDIRDMLRAFFHTVLKRISNRGGKLDGRSDDFIPLANQSSQEYRGAAQQYDPAPQEQGLTYPPQTGYTPLQRPGY